MWCNQQSTDVMKDDKAAARATMLTKGDTTTTNYSEGWNSAGGRRGSY